MVVAGLVSFIKQMSDENHSFGTPGCLPMEFVVGEIFLLTGFWVLCEY